VTLFIQPAYADYCAVNVTSVPSGAKVYINGEYVGDAPVFYIFGDPIVAEIAVEKEGYVEWKRHVDVPLNEIVDVRAELEPLKEEATTPDTGLSESRAQEKGICGPILILVLAMLPIYLRHLRI